MTETQQLYKLQRNGISTSEKNFYPVTLVQSVFDGTDGNRLDIILNNINHMYLPWKGSLTSTRLLVKSIARRKGYTVTFRDTSGKIYTQRFIGDEFDDTSWCNNANWEEANAVSVDSTLSTTSFNPVENKVITEAINSLNTKFDNLVKDAPEAYDTLKEIADYIATHKTEYDALLSISENKANKSDVYTKTETISNFYNKTQIDKLLGDIQTGNNTTLEGYYTKNETDNLLATKVTAVAGKGLSTNDFTNTYKTALSNQKVVTALSHTHNNTTGYTIKEDYLSSLVNGTTGSQNHIIPIVSSTLSGLMLPSHLELLNTLNTKITELTSRIEELEGQLNEQLAVDVTVSPESFEEGSSVRPALTITTSVNGDAVQADSVIIYRNGTRIADITPTSDTFNYTDSMMISTNTTYMVIATYNGKSVTGSAIITTTQKPEGRPRLYFGGNMKGPSELTAADILAMNYYEITDNITARENVPMSIPEAGYGWFAVEEGITWKGAIGEGGFEFAVDPDNDVTVNGKIYKTYVTSKQHAYDWSLTLN